jgi:hypothetical protein
MEQMRAHPEIGARLLGPVVGDIAEWVLAHHERIDGTGYPHGLGAEEIPIEARILAVADAFEAMTSDRPTASQWRAGRGRRAARGGRHAVRPRGRRRLRPGARPGPGGRRRGLSAPPPSPQRAAAAAAAVARRTR